MKAVYAILKRELRSYFASPTAYIILLVFLVLSGIFFFVYLETFLQLQNDPRYYQEAPNLNEMIISLYFGTINILLLLMVPLITMRLLAEEKKSFTGEMLFTSPVRTVYIVLGKYLASLTLFVTMLCLSYVNVAMLQVYGNPDGGPIFTGYLGLFLVGASFLSIGLFASSLTENQMIAAIISFGTLLVFWVVGASSEMSSSVAGYLSIINHFESFINGVLEVRDIVYYVTLTLFGLFLTNTVLDSERWR
ncbi:MAG: ABC transporter permease [Candidatus Dadabacteria bacterium]|nr:ABC transporter permease [Candidatus Dadabacteria bacterium]